MTFFSFFIVFFCKLNIFANYNTKKVVYQYLNCNVDVSRQENQRKFRRVTVFYLLILFLSHNTRFD